MSIYILVTKHLFVLQVLTFDAFYCEPLGELDQSTTRYRKCKVLYFLEDDELKVFEPRGKNSGQNQGKVVFKECMLVRFINN